MLFSPRLVWGHLWVPLSVVWQCQGSEGVVGAARLSTQLSICLSLPMCPC